MEFLNKVEIRGIVGMAETQTFNDTKITRFSVMTETCSTAKNGLPVVEVSWFNCTAIPAENPLHGEIKKGDKIHLHGRIRQRRYTDQYGADRTTWDIKVSDFTILEK